MVALEHRPSSSGVYAAQDAAVLINATAPVIHDLPSGLHPLPLVTTRHVYRWVREGLSGRYLEGLRGREVALTFRPSLPFAWSRSFGRMACGQRKSATHTTNCNKPVGGRTRLLWNQYGFPAWISSFEKTTFQLYPPAIGRLPLISLTNLLAPFITCCLGLANRRLLGSLNPAYCLIRPFHLENPA